MKRLEIEQNKSVWEDLFSRESPGFRYNRVRFPPYIGRLQSAPYKYQQVFDDSTY